MRALQYLNKYFSKYKWRILIGLLITILSKLLSLKIPQIIRDSLNVVEDYHNNVVTDIAVVKDQLLINVLIIIGIALLGGVLTELVMMLFVKDKKSNTMKYMTYFFIVVFMLYILYDTKRLQLNAKKCVFFKKNAICSCIAGVKKRSPFFIFLILTFEFFFLSL